MPTSYMENVHVLNKLLQCEWLKVQKNRLQTHCEYKTRLSNTRTVKMEYYFVNFVTLSTYERTIFSISSTILSDCPSVY
jgi:hypothetical protein